jgi:alpha-1,2-mannosyltransferase
MSRPRTEASAARDPRQGAAGDPVTTRIIIVCVLVGVGIDALQLSRPGFLFGGTSDISVYLAGAVRLVHGTIAYRDFVFVQPPGIVVLLSPFGLLSNFVGTRGALAALRMFTPLIAGTNVLLVGRVVRHRGRLTALVACGLMALYPAERYALNAGLLEPVTDLFCLAGASLVFDRDNLAGPRRALLGGVLFGIAGAVKAPAVVVVLVVGAMCVSSPRGRLLPFLGGVVAGFGCLSLAFFVMAPGAFFHDVVVSQLSRVPGSGRAPAVMRLEDITVGGGTVGAYVAVAVVVVVVLAAFAIRRRRLTPLETFALASAVAVGAVQFVTTQYYPQYPAFLAPFLVIVIGLAVNRLAPPMHADRLVPAIVAAGLCVLLVSQVAAVEGATARDYENAVDAVVPAGACALSDGPVILFTTDRFLSSVPGCTEMVDPFGTMLAFAHDPAGGTATFRSALSSVDYLVLSTGVDSWLRGAYVALLPYVGAHFHVMRSGVLYVYVRNGFPA